MKLDRVRSLLPLAGLAVLSAGCFISDVGTDPAIDGFYYPTGLIVSPGKTTLFVANSDFDLQFNGGTVLALDLTALRPKLTQLLSDLDPANAVSLKTTCANFSGKENDNVILFPGPCRPLDISDAKQGKPNPIIRRGVTLGAFASGVALAEQGGSARLFVPVRGDPSITFLDIANDRTPTTPATVTLNCGGSIRCGASHRVGLDPFDNTRQLALPVEPVGIAASEDGLALVIAHQTQATVSLVVNRLPDPANSLSRPTLEFLLPVADGPTEVATVPIPREIVAAKASYAPGFLVSYRAVGQVDLLRFQSDANSAPPRPFLTRVLQVSITTNADGKDSRGIAVDATARQACEAPCRGAPDELACLRPLKCTDIPLRIFVANRLPASLLVGKIKTTLVEDALGNITGAFDVPTIEDTVPLAFGASKVTVGQVIGSDGKPQTRVFAAAFDSRLVFSYDPVARQVESVIHTGRGPHALVADSDFTTDPANPHAFLYVGHFTDSYMGVVDLDMRNPDTFGTMFAGIGTPIPPKESK